MTDAVIQPPLVADVVGAKLDVRSPDLSAGFNLATDVNNMTSGITMGYGPRAGTAPLVGQNIDLAVDAHGTMGCYGSVSITAPCAGFQRVYGIVGVSVLDQEQVGVSYNPIAKKTYYWACIAIHPFSDPPADPGKLFLVWVPFGVTSAINNDGTGAVWDPKAALAYGLLQPYLLSGTSPAYNLPTLARFSGLTAGNINAQQQALEDYLSVLQPQTATGQSLTLDYCQTAVLSVAGVSEPCPYLAGLKKSTPDSTHSATIDLDAYGTPNFMIDRRLTAKLHSWSMIDVATSGIGLEAQYNFNKLPTLTDLLPTADQNVSATAQVTGSYITGSATLVTRVDGAGPNYSAVSDVLWHDETNQMNTEHSLLLAAAQKPICMLIQGWNRSPYRSLEQWIDLRNPIFAAASRQTVNTNGLGGRYTESGINGTSATPVDTCWDAWTPYVDGTATPTLAAASRTGSTGVPGPLLGPANSGILRANTRYEFAYSIYDKQLGIETNVGNPAQILTGTDDFVAMTLWADNITTGNYDQRCAGGSVAGVWKSSQFISGVYGTNLINYVQFRVYYRPAGQFEWLPALAIDAAQYFFDPNLKELWVCQGPVAGSTGGQPGAFNDFSPLPDDQYTSVVVWKNRVFWLSQKTLIFSLKNNGFAYPIDNAFSIQSGSYKGFLVHNYPGQADQDSRLIVFGTVETYVGKFTGVFQQMSVQVDATNVGTFNVDGSDFVLNTWTSVTAFSYRSACVCDGILYWWGPQGVYRDDGVQTPTKISYELEPLLSTLYSKQRTDDIHCFYNEITHEITWFYFTDDQYASIDPTTPKTSLLIYNVRTGAYTFSSMALAVDASAKVSTGDGVDFVSPTGGSRAMIYCRKQKNQSVEVDFPQIPYFYDQRNRAGDMGLYERMFMVSLVSTPVAGSRRLTLPNGTDGMTVGDFISADQIQAYTNNQDSSGTAIVVEDFVALVTAVTSTTIDIQLPTDIDPAFSAAWTAGALYAFPIYNGKSLYGGTEFTRGNAFPYQLTTTYWCPNDVSFNAFWLYLHLLFKMDLLPSAGLGTSFGATIGHRTPVSLDWNYQSLVFGKIDSFGNYTPVVNSNGNHQIYLPLQGVDQMEGQGLKLSLAGLQFANKWTLQYLGAYANPQVFDFLKQFEV